MPDKMVFLKNAADHKALIDQLELLDETVYKAAVLIAGTFRSGGKLIICGNGGSAADAQHMAAELSGRYLKDRKALDAVALSCNSSAITAIANDYSFGDVFARQVEAHGKKGDVLLAISTSGNSLNIINAVSTARENGLATIGLTGLVGGKMREMIDLVISVPSSSTPRIQEAHLLIEHSICEIIENMVCEGGIE